MTRSDEVWKREDLAHAFLDNVRAAIPMAAEQIDIMLRVIRGRAPVDGSFIDLGCGDGILGHTVHAMYPRSTGFFLDFSEAMIDAARKKGGADAGGLYFIVSDYASPEWTGTVAAAAPFDLIISGYSIHHQPDERKRSLYREIFDLLKPGGLFLNLDTVTPEPEWTETVWDDLFIDSLFKFEQQKGPERSRDQVAEEWLSRPDKTANILAPLGDQCNWLKEAGFIDVACYFKVLAQTIFGGIKPDGAD